MVETFSKLEEVGEYVQETWQARVTDPCYGLDTHHAITIPAKMGIWHVGVIRDGYDIAALLAWHESVSLRDIKRRTVWRRHLEAPIYVDSGQAGIFDLEYYDNDNEEWYDACCAETLSDSNAGVISHGCVSSSGCGDGRYEMYTQTDVEGDIVAIAIDYLDAFEEEVYCPTCGGSEYTCQCE